MNTYWDRLFRRSKPESAGSDFRSKLSSPVNRNWRRQLEQVLARSGSDAEFTLEHIHEMVHPPSVEELAVALAGFVENGRLRQVFRVQSRTQHGSIGDYSSLAEVPRSLLDWRADEYINVSPADLRVIYKHH